MTTHDQKKDAIGIQDHVRSLVKRANDVSKVLVPPVPVPAGPSLFPTVPGIEPLIPRQMIDDSLADLFKPRPYFKDPRENQPHRTRPSLKIDMDQARQIEKDIVQLEDFVDGTISRLTIPDLGGESLRPSDFITVEVTPTGEPLTPTVENREIFRIEDALRAEHIPFKRQQHVIIIPAVVFGYVLKIRIAKRHRCKEYYRLVNEFQTKRKTYPIRKAKVQTHTQRRLQATKAIRTYYKFKNICREL